MAVAKALNAAQGMIDYILGQEGPYGFGSASTAEDVAERYSNCIRGRVFMITGCTSGMGREVAFVLAKHGGIVVMASRSKVKLDATQAQIQSSHPHAVTHTIECDLGSLRSVNDAIRDYNRLNLPGLNVLICNAGIAFTSWSRAGEMGGVESQFATNYLGHYALCKGLLPELVRGGMPATERNGGSPARIILVSSVLHKVAYFPQGIRLHDLSGELYYEPIEAYGQSKLAMLLFMEELGKRIQERHLPITVNALHPGPVNSSITRHFLGLPELSGWHLLGQPWAFTSPIYVAYTKFLGKSVPQGAAAHIFLAASPDVKSISGGYWVDCRQEEYWHYALVRNPKLGAELWAKSAKLTGHHGEI